MTGGGTEEKNAGESKDSRASCAYSTREQATQHRRQGKFGAFLTPAPPHSNPQYTTIHYTSVYIYTYVLTEGGRRFMAAWRKEEVVAARHRQEKREATRLGKLPSYTEAA